MKILINYLTHGEETLGIKVTEKLKGEYTDLLNDSLFFSIANKRAHSQGKRYIDADLNRVFPGKPDGNHEERLAATLVEELKNFDLVIDVHSTKSETRDTVIITKTSPLITEAIRIIQPRYVLEMRVNSDGALISHAKNGIAIEFGNNDDERVLERTTLAIRCLIDHFLMNKKTAGLGLKTEHYQALHQVEKPAGYKLLPNVKNFALVPAGQPYATCEGMPDLMSKDNFYPVIFGQDNYETIFGFAAIKKTDC